MPSRNPLVNLFSVLARGDGERFCPVAAVRNARARTRRIETGAQAIQNTPVTGEEA